MDILQFLKLGNLFTFPRNKLIKNLLILSGNKKDMRKNLFGLSSTKIKKGATGLKLNTYEAIQDTRLSIPKSDYLIGDYMSNFKSLSDIQDEVVLKYLKNNQTVTMDTLQNDKLANDLTVESVNTPPVLKKPAEDYSKYVGFSGFSKAYDEVEKEVPEAKLYRGFLTKIAQHESGFNAKILNKAGAPAYGYFLFMQDGKKWNNITKYSGLSIDEFRNNPKEQIKAAIKLAKAFMSSFSLEDINKARSMGISMSGMLGGAWLGGAGGVKKALNGIDSSDKHWSKDGKTGSSVMECFKRYNNL